MRIKFFLALVALGVSMWAAAPVQAACGKHGFWVFGGDRIFLSHKPLYGSACHGKQLVLEVVLTDSSKLVTLKNAMTAGEVTFGPTGDFSLQTLTVGSTVKGAFSKGNFEDDDQSATPLFQGTIQVKKVLVERSLLETPKSSPGALSGFLLKSGSTHYLLNSLDRSRDLDQVVEIKPKPGQSMVEVGDDAHPVQLPGRQFLAGKKPNTLTAMDSETAGFTSSDGKKVHFSTTRVIFRASSSDGFKNSL